MNIDTAAPLGLVKANLELSLRTGKLLQEYAQQWLELYTRAGKDELAESNAELSDVAAAPDWQALAALPVESFWRQVQQRYGDLEAASQIAVCAQTTFAHGLQNALNEWQKSAAATLGTGFAAPTLATPFDDILKQWNAGFASLLPNMTAAMSNPFTPTPKPEGTPRGK